MKTVTHLVVTDNFAGVERYVSVVAGISAERGWAVRVLGGRERDMRRELLPGVLWAPAPTLVTALGALRRAPVSDVLHVHMTAAEVAAALVPRGRVVIATRHFASRRGSSPAARMAASLAARRLDGELAISETVRRASGDPKMRVLLSAVPVDERARSPQRTIVVAQRLEKEKRTTDVVKAFALSGIAAYGWTLEIYGQGSERERVLAEVERAHVGRSTRLHGWSDDMSSVLSSAGVVVAPADREPFGLLVAEAMAAGAPVLAAAGGGHLETLGAVPGARLYAPADVEACARELRTLSLEGPAQRQAYGDRLREWQRRHLAVEGHTDRLLEHYVALLRARGIAGS